MGKRLILTLILLAGGFSAAAQKGNIGYVYPAGAQRGSSIELTVGGQNLSKAQGLIVSGEGVSAELLQTAKSSRKRKNKDIGEEDNLQLADRVRFRIRVSKNAEPGLRDLRLVLEDGSTTNRLYFEIGELPDVCENPDAELSATAPALPVTFNGQVMRSDRDRFRFHADKGNHLVLRVKGRIFVPYLADAVPGWFQPVIRLYGPDGKECAFNDDYRWEVDPVLLYTAPESGDYAVEINDALYRGREDFVYRIDVGELPFITSVSPLGGPAGARCKLTLQGVNLPARQITFKAKGEGKLPVCVTGKNGLHSNRLWFYADPFAQFQPRKAAPNTLCWRAWTLPLGESCEQSFSTGWEQYWYRLQLDKKATVHLNVLARRLGAPTDVRMTLYDENLNLLQDVDDVEDEDEFLDTHFADPELTLTLKPGQYYVRLTEAQAHGGGEYAFRFSWNAASPDFSLRIEPATLSVPAGGTGVFSVILNPKQKFRGAVDLDVNGLPAGFRLEGNRIEAGRKRTLVSVTAPQNARREPLLPTVSGTSADKGEPVTREALPVESMMQAFYYTHLLPMEEFRVEVSPAQPFRVKVLLDGSEPLRLTRKGATALKVVLERDPGFDAAVTLMLKSSESFVKANAVVIPEGESEGVLEIAVTRDLKGKSCLYPRLAVAGLVKGSSAKIAGKGRNAFVAAITAYSPVFIAEL